MGDRNPALYSYYLLFPENWRVVSRSTNTETLHTKCAAVAVGCATGQTLVTLWTCCVWVQCQVERQSVWRAVFEESGRHWLMWHTHRKLLVTAQCFSFFANGFEASSAVLLPFFIVCALSSFIAILEFKLRRPPLQLAVLVSYMCWNRRKKSLLFGFLWSSSIYVDYLLQIHFEYMLVIHWTFTYLG